MRRLADVVVVSFFWALFPVEASPEGVINAPQLFIHLLKTFDCFGSFFG